ASSRAEIPPSEKVWAAAGALACRRGPWQRAREQREKTAGRKRKSARSGTRTRTVAHTPLKRARLPIPPSEQGGLPRWFRGETRPAPQCEEGATRVSRT